MARVYATVEELEEFTGQPAPANAARLLARASRLVDRALIAAVYDTDTAGYPQAPEVRTGLRDAVCAQVGVWAGREAAGAGDGSDPAASPWTSISAGGLSFSRPSAPTAPVDDTALTPEAVEILEGLGLEQVVWT